MRLIGFSTGALALGDFRRALSMMSAEHLSAIELSALREHELRPLIHALPSLNLAAYQYISVHAPSRFVSMSDSEAVSELQIARDNQWPIIVHPDVLRDLSAWRCLGSSLCIENMDGRKPIGRNVSELLKVFDSLPEASFCFDIGHAHQIDPSMELAQELLETFAPRLREVHLSHVTNDFSHHRLDDGAIEDFRTVATLIPEDVPIILETPVPDPEMCSEIGRALEALTPATKVRGP
jgi:hypothetical protein